MPRRERLQNFGKPCLETSQLRSSGFFHSTSHKNTISTSHQLGNGKRCANLFARASSDATKLISKVPVNDSLIGRPLAMTDGLITDKFIDP